MDSGKTGQTRVSDAATLSDLGEFGLIARLQPRFARGGAGIARGIGDDTAALQPSPDHLLLATTDALVEGVHFLVEKTTPVALGRRALAVNLSDIAAMAGTPRWALVSFGFPTATPISLIDGLAEGLAEEARLFETEIVGGNVARSPDRVMISITVLGEVAPTDVVYRTGARVGDRLLVTGTLGDSAAGLAVLTGAAPLGVPGEDYLVARHRLPTPRVSTGRAIGQSHLATAMIDLSDGVAGDAEHVADESHVGVVVYADRVPLSDPLRTLARAVGVNTLEWALRGGEDYELLLTAASDNVAALTAVVNAQGVTLTEIGEIIAGSGVLLARADGRREPIGTVSWQHFG